MNTNTITNNDLLINEAGWRGILRGQDDRLNGLPRNEAPLSGEWAGESITELLGDLIAQMEGEDEGDFVNDLCDSYERCYNHAYDDFPNDDEEEGY